MNIVNLNPKGINPEYVMDLNNDISLVSLSHCQILYLDDIKIILLYPKKEIYIRKNQTNPLQICNKSNETIPFFGIPTCFLNLLKSFYNQL